MTQALTRPCRRKWPAEGHSDREWGKLVVYLESEWQRKDATLSDKTARKEFGLTQDEIARAIGAGRLQFRENAIHGNPFLRLLRREVEALVENEYGDDYLKAQQTRTELAHINRELKRLKAQVATLEQRKSQLVADLGRRRLRDDGTRMSNEERGR